MKKTKNELEDELCNYCPCTEYGTRKIGRGPWDLCENCCCDEAYETYLEDNQDKE